MDYLPKLGERCLIAGQTGSGKTSFAIWMLSKLRYPIVLYDTKGEPKFETIAKPRENFNDVKRDLQKTGRAVFRPSIEAISDPLELDKLLTKHYQELDGVGAYIDEVYQWHNNGRAGPGLMALLTRGRSRGITTILSTQRPLWLSRFALTEAQKFYIFRLVDKADRNRLTDIIPTFSALKQPPKYWHWFYNQSEDGIMLIQPTKLKYDPGYTDLKSGVNWI